MSEADLILIISKHYAKGIGTNILESVIARMRTDRIKIAILFTSKMDGVWSNDEKRNGFMKSDLLANGETCLLYLCKDKEPKWVTTLSDVPLRPT